jgi:hypothetical protein
MHKKAVSHGAFLATAGAAGLATCAASAAATAKPKREQPILIH